MIANGLCGLSFRNNFSEAGEHVPTYVSTFPGMRHSDCHIDVCNPVGKLDNANRDEYTAQVVNKSSSWKQSCYNN